MRVTVNLASRPFLELRPLYLRLRVLIVLLALLSLPLWLLLRSESRKANAAQARLTAIDNRMQALQREQQEYESDMRRPRNAAVLSQSQFLNRLFAQKAFSWTAVMMDLENVLPNGVQVLNIDPVLSREGLVTIRLRVSGQRDRAVDLVRNLEHSHRFLFPRLASESADTTQNGRGLEQASVTGGVNFDVVAEYNPLPQSTHAAKPSKHLSVKPPPAARRRPSKLRRGGAR